MSKRKIVYSSDDDDENYIPPPQPLKKAKNTEIICRPKLVIEDLPQIKSLDELIKIGESNKFYKNINMFTLWDILPYLKELQEMIGMKSVKESIFYQVIYYIQGMHERNKDGDYLHTIISGKSGCGKTTVSKILCNIYKNLNILSKNGKFKIAHREDFVAEYLGQTAVKTKKLLNSCIGGCLFVDEIYALGPGQKDKDSFSKEAIDTINVFLSEHKNDFVFIAAGYKEQIDKCFFSVNEGLKRRFQWNHIIEDYSTEDLVQIFKKMVKEINWDLKVEDSEFITLFKENINLFKDSGGSMENLLTKIKLAHSKRILGQDKKFRFIINKEDVHNAISVMKQFEKKEEKKTYEYYT